MSNAKTGGNKKSSSASDTGYWARAKASKFDETHRERRIARHIKHNRSTLAKKGKIQPTSKTKLTAANGLSSHINFPHVTLARGKERVTFTGNVPEMRVFDSYGNVIGHPKFTIVNGIVTDVQRARN
jgi:hypothetical protein